MSSVQTTLPINASEIIMEESSQSNPCFATCEEQFAAGLSRDVNTLCTLAAIQFNNLNNAFTNIETILNTIDPALAADVSPISLFALTDIKHLIDVAFGNDREVSLDPLQEEE